MNDETKTENINASGDQAAEFCTYLLTIRRAAFNGEEALELRDYFEMLGRAGCEVLVVDGSPEEVFDLHAGVWREACRHEPVDPQYEFLNGKVNGIHNGVAIASHEAIILADDDLVYAPADARRMADLLSEYDLVRPQNYFSPLPFWARMETARKLINRAWIPEGDYSGSLGVRREAMRRVGHYDGDVLFDNEEMVRHFRLKGARIKYARDFFLEMRPASFRKWLEQRPRQAYEDFILIPKTFFFAALPVAFILTGLNAGWRMAAIYALIVAVGSILLAARGLSDGAWRYFPPSSVFFAPLWIVERCFSTYWAFYWYLTRGGYPFGDRLVSKGTGDAWRAAPPARED